MRSFARKLAASAAALGALLPFAAGAHHSFAAEFLMDSVVEIEGRVTDLDWVNPHIKFQVAGSDGESWEVEAGPVNLVSRMGIEKSMLAVGSTLRVRGNPGRDDAKKTLWVSNVLLQNGTELLVAPGARPHWNSTALGDASAFFAAGDAKLPDGSQRTLFRIWSPLISAFPRPRGEPELTEAGRRAQARYEGGEQAVADCELPGMPFAMMSPYPIEIVNEGERLTLRGEAYDLTRTIHLGAPPSTGPSPLGTSRGRVSGNELVVETDGIDYHSYGDLGPAQSNQSKVVERFTLSADGTRLEYDITITDPVMLAEPWTWGGSFVYREGAEIRPWNCGADRG